MEYSSLTFLFLFLPLFLIFFWPVRKTARNAVLILASLVFYSWGEGSFVFFLLVSILINYLFGLWVGKGKGKKGGPLAFALALVFNIGILAFFKYTHFIMDNLNPVLKGIGLSPVSLEPIHLPIGISFITFQAISYIVDIRRERALEEKNVLRFSVYLGSFPKLIMGPITPYHRMAPQLTEREVSGENFFCGIRRFILGLGKKVLIADQLAPTANHIFAIPAADQTVGLAWLGIVCFGLQIYFDFSGYSDMAIGIGRICGFRLDENFNYPYMASSIKDFWRRWHISLASWLRDYLFLPMAYAVSRKIKSERLLHLKAEDWAYHIGSFFTMLVCGLWHGANWTFVFWGIFYGVMLIVEHAGLGKIVKKLWWPLRILYTQLLVICAWVFFRSDNFSYALKYLKAMCGLGSGDGTAYYPSLYVNSRVLVFIGIGLLASFPIIKKFSQLTEPKDPGKQNGAKRFMSRGIEWIADLSVLFIFVFSVMALSGGTHTPFIYFRF